MGFFAVRQVSSWFTPTQRRRSPSRPGKPSAVHSWSLFGAGRTATQSPSTSERSTSCARRPTQWCSAAAVAAARAAVAATRVRSAMAVAELFFLQAGLAIDAEAAAVAATALAGRGHLSSDPAGGGSEGSAKRRKMALHGVDQSWAAGGRAEARACGANPQESGAVAVGGGVPKPQQASESWCWPLVGRKRPRGAALEQAAASGRTVEASCARLQAAFACGAGREGALAEGCEAVCRRFANRVSAAGAEPAYLRLDTLTHVQVVKWLRKHEGAVRTAAQKSQPQVVN
mmetsp:Transcript_40462/g.115720  ORF Transcript_40462/g.115720 Transcript_40462/m.115720 type:complete len:287 (+) Transcript_40462:909-1769(+)